MGLATLAAVTVADPAHAGPTRLTAATYAATGTVVRDDGAADRAITVTAYRADGSEADSRAGQATAGIDGRFTITGLTAGRYRFEYRATTDPAYLPQCGGGVLKGEEYRCEKGTVTTIDGRDAVLPEETLRFRVPRAAGVVSGVGGRPLAGVNLNDVDEGTTWTTDAQGRYSVPLVRRTYQVAKTGYEQQFRTFAAGAPNEVQRVDLRLRSRNDLVTTVRTGRAKATAVVRVRPVVASASTAGTVSVRYKKPNGSAGTRTRAVASSGTVSIHLPRVKTGTRTLTVSHAGNVDLAPVTEKVSARVG